MYKRVITVLMISVSWFGCNNESTPAKEKLSEREVEEKVERSEEVLPEAMPERYGMQDTTAEYRARYEHIEGFFASGRKTDAIKGFYLKDSLIEIDFFSTYAALKKVRPQTDVTEDDFQKLQSGTELIQRYMMSIPVFIMKPADFLNTVVVNMESTTKRYRGTFERSELEMYVAERMKRAEGEGKFREQFTELMIKNPEESAMYFDKFVKEFDK
jgi:hypothetical protein